MPMKVFTLYSMCICMHDRYVYANVPPVTATTADSDAAIWL